jgi:hypothetical protein
MISPPKVGAPAPVTRIAAAAVSNWEVVESRLAPIIGADGFRVLYARSLHRARVQHPWLARDPVKGEPLFATLHASLEAESPERAAQASRALTEDFNQLLDALIGKELAARLLARFDR